MTPPAPPSIKAYFAKNAPICVLVRCGPRRRSAQYSQMILWHTDTDVFVPGQWIRGKVHEFTMTSDGKYAAIGIMGKEQHLFVCRPPYFTALEVWGSGLCRSTVVILPGDRLLANAGAHKIHAQNRCPLHRVSRDYGEPFPREHDYRLDSRGRSALGVDQQGRKILLSRGRVFACDQSEPRLLFDCNEHSFEEVVAPDWAKNW